MKATEADKASRKGDLMFLSVFTIAIATGFLVGSGYILLVYAVFPLPHELRLAPTHSSQRGPFLTDLSRPGIGVMAILPSHAPARGETIFQPWR